MGKKELEMPPFSRMKGGEEKNSKTRKEAFQVSRSRREKERQCKRRIDRRLCRRNWEDQPEPMFAASNIHYEINERTRALGPGGIGAIHHMVRKVGLDNEINAQVPLLKKHLPYHESDHVLNIAYNLLCGGSCLDDIELWRSDESYLNALGAQRIPDPTTAGDFCRRFELQDVEALMSAIHAARVRIWQQQPEGFFEEAVVDADGTLAPTTGECKEGMDISSKGIWGYHPLVVSLANTGEPLYLVNRPASRPSHEGAAERLDQAIELCREAGYRSILLRGDTDFSQTAYLDGWDEQGDVRFVFGMDAHEKVRGIAESLGRQAWERLERPAKYEVKTQTRARPANVKEVVVQEREFENIRLRSEDVAEFAYRPHACKRTYRMVVVRKNLTIEKGEYALFDDVRYFFYITNDWSTPADEIVLLANQRCDQENLLAQLKTGARALQMPVDNLVSNWAYMVMASLAWTLKAWFALLLPEGGRWAEKYQAEKHAVLRMEFRTFVSAFMRVPCQIVRTGRRIAYRLLSWNRWQAVFLRGVDALAVPLRT